MKRFILKLARQKGTALMLSLFTMFIISVLIGIGFTILLNSMDIIKRQLQYRGQSENIAKAGLIEAHSWLRRQDTQPVRPADSNNPTADDYGFDPIVDISDPANKINDSDEPDIGIVRTFQIGENNRIYGRYEVRRYSKRKPYKNKRKYTWRDKNFASYCKDISEERGKTSYSGTIWRMESVGYIYVQNDANKPFYESPNQILQSVILATEFQRLGLNLAPAAIHLNDDMNITVSNKGKVDGLNDPGVMWHGSDYGRLNTSANGTVDGNPVEQVSGDSLSESAIFGVTKEELKSMADYYVTSSSDLPDIRFSMATIYIDGNAQFTSTRPLKGSGILYVDGNLTFSNNCGAYWSGLIYCTSNITMGDDATIMGTVVATGNSVNVHGSGEVAEITYDEDILQAIQQKIGQYRMSRSPYQIPLS